MIDKNTGEILADETTGWTGDHTGTPVSYEQDPERTYMPRFILRAGCIGGPLNYDTNADADATGTTCLDLDKNGELRAWTRTQQQFKDDADINTIVKRFGITGELPIAERTPLEGEFFDTFDYQQTLNALNNAQQAFDDLPADVRRQFDNDPGRLIAFLQDDKNRPEAERLGIVNKRPEPPAAEPQKDTASE